MTTTDSQGILYLEETDSVSPLHTTLNALQSATSEVIGDVRRGPLHAANDAERNALLTTHGSSPTEPLWVDVAGILQRHNGTIWQSMTGAITGNTSVPAFSLPSAVPPATILATTTLTHPFVGEVVVDAELVGDAVVGANTSVRFLLTVSGLARPAWVQNFGGGNLRDSPHARVITTVPAGSPVTVTVQAADVGSGGTSGSAGVLAVAWMIRPGRGA